MILSLKAIAYSTSTRTFCSPSRTDFAWQKGIMASSCHKNHDISNLEKVTDGIKACTCGLYSSPNEATLEEYKHYPNSIIVLLKLYGFWDLWTAPADIKDAFVMRSWGARIIGVQMEDKTTQRYMSSVLAAQTFDVNIYPKSLVEEMLQANWVKNSLSNPFPNREVPWQYERREP